MKALTALILTALLAACGGGEDLPTATVAPVYLPVTEGVRCGSVDKANAPAGWCANSDDAVHLGKPNS